MSSIKEGGITCWATEWPWAIWWAFLLCSNAGLNSFLLLHFFPSLYCPSWGVWARLLVESCGKLVMKLPSAKNNFFFAGFLIQISSLIYFAAQPALQLKELLLKALLVTQPGWTTSAGEWSVPVPLHLPGVGSHRGFLPILSISLAGYLWMRKELSHLFLGTAPLLRLEMAFRRTAQPSVLTLWKKSAVSQLRAQFSLSLLESQPVCLACSICFGSGRSANACWLASLSFNLTDMEDCLEPSFCSKVNPPVVKRALL